MIHLTYFFFFFLQEKLAAELESIQRQNEERFDMQISDYQNMQDGIATINFNVGETQRK